MADPARSAPTFSSFPHTDTKRFGRDLVAAPNPSFRSFPDPPGEKLGESSSSQIRPPSSSRRKLSRHPKEGRSAHDGPENTRSSRSTTRHHEPEAHPPVGQRISERGPSSEYYFHDNVGDKDALRYGIDASRLAPKYRQNAGGRVLGLSQQYRAVHTTEKNGRGLEVAKAGRSFIPRYASGYRDHRKRLRFSAKPIDLDFSATYLAVNADPGGRVARETDSPASDSQEVDTDVEDYAQQVHKRMETHLASHPTDIDSWIAFSKAHWTDGRGHRKAELDVSLAILSRALRSEQSSRSIPLQLEYLRTAAELWPFQRVDEAWKALLSQSAEGERGGSGLLQLRLGYLDWISGSGFGQGAYDGDGVMAAFEDILLDMRSHGSSDQTCEENQLYIFTRACFFLRRMGYEEKAIASFQSLLELTLAQKPSDLDGFNRILDDFGDYWDSGAIRLGEDGAQGWGNVPFVSDNRAHRVNDHESRHVSVSDPYMRWAHDEWTSTERDKMPARMDDMDEGDPHRAIIFSDIRSLMFPIVASDTAEQLCWTFLHFLGAYIRPPGAPTSLAISNDSHIMPTCVPSRFWPSDTPKPFPPWQALALQDGDRRTTKFPMECCATDRDTIWAADWTTENLDIALIRNVLDITKRHFPDTEVDTHILALEAAMSVKAAMKSAKAKLSHDRGNLTLWAGYARLERLRGNTQAARNVYAAAMSQAGQVQSLQESPALLLLADWVHMEWTLDESDRCQDILIRVASGQSLDPPAEAAYSAMAPSKLAVLKSRRFYEDAILPMSRSALVLSTLFAYQRGLNEVRKVLDTQVESCPDGSFDQEIAHQFYTEVLVHYAARHPGPASLVRVHLEQVVVRYPDNTLFLGEILSQQSKTGLHSRLHALTARLTGSDSRLIGMIWAIWAEAQLATDFYHPGSGGASRVRALLARALSTENGRQSPILWLMGIEFESKVGQYQAAKKLFYRAMAQIGACKDLYLLAFQDPLRRYFTDVELGQIVEHMVERGLRLRCDPGDYWQPQDTERDLPSDEELEDDELRFLTERQAMRPY